MPTPTQHPKRDLFLAIKARLFDQVKEIKHIRLFNNQFQRDTVEEAYNPDAVFIEFLQLTWVGVARNQQTADTVIRLHINFESLKTEDLEVFERVQKVYLALQGFNGPLFSSMQRVNDEQDTDHDNVIVWKTDFHTQMQDCTSDPRASLDTFTISQIDIDAQLDIDYEIIRTGDGIF